MATSGFPRHLTSNHYVSHFCTDRFEQRFDPALRDPTRDEDDAASAIIRRPTLEPGGRVKDMLDAISGAAAWPIAARAQQPGKLLTVGCIVTGMPSSHGKLVVAHNLARYRRQSTWLPFPGGRLAARAGA
jgi:hypothetical protein